MNEAMVNTQMRAWRAAGGRLPLAGAHSLVERTFRLGDIPSLRRLAVEFGARAGIESARLQDFVLAVSEAAACAVAGGPCTARLRLWTTGPRAFCEVHGDGNNSMMWQGPGGIRQDDAEALRRWLLHQLCDYVSVESGHGGVTVLLSMTVI
jgi:hypothetical protein